MSKTVLKKIRGKGKVQESLKTSPKPTAATLHSEKRYNYYGANLGRNFACWVCLFESKSRIL